MEIVGNEAGGSPWVKLHSTQGLRSRKGLYSENTGSF